MQSVAQMYCIELLTEQTSQGIFVSAKLHRWKSKSDANLFCPRFIGHPDCHPRFPNIMTSPLQRPVLKISQMPASWIVMYFWFWVLPSRQPITTVSFQKNITIHGTNTSAVQPFNFKPIQLSHQELFWPRSKYFHICGWWKQLDLHNHNLRTPSWFAQIFTFNESHPFGQFSSSSRFFLAVA